MIPEEVPVVIILSVCQQTPHAFDMNKTSLNVMLPDGEYK